MGNTQQTKDTTSKRRKRATVLAGLILAAGLIIGLLATPQSAGFAEEGATVPVRKGTLVASVQQKGDVWSLEPTEFKCEVEGRSTILELVEEGTVVTEQDVEDGMVLARLDASELERQEADREISLFRAEADYLQAQEALRIQQKQNESDLAQAKLAVKFARLDLERYLGTQLAGEVLQQQADLQKLAERENLGGTARQQLRDLEAQVQVASEELTRAEEDLEWTRRLEGDGYVSTNELRADQLAAERRRIQLQAAEQELALFKRYTLPKEAEEFRSDYVESKRNLERVRARVKSELSQAEAEVKSSKANYELQQQRLEKTRDMVEKCVIRATRPGRVIYGGATNPWARRDEDIREGGDVRQNQVLFRVPDISRLAVRLDVPETEVEKLRKGQPALIRLQANDGQTVTGHVEMISPMASTQAGWLNVDTKFYEVNVALDEPPERYTPGMSATVRIVVARAEDVLHVPLQSVTDYKDHSFCWVKGADGAGLREVQTGRRSDKYIEITHGLRLGEEVYLTPPPDFEETVLEERVRKAGPAKAEPQRNAPEEAAGSGRQETTEAQRPERSGQQLSWSEIQQQFRGLAELSQEQRRSKMSELWNKMTDEQKQRARQLMQQQFGNRSGRGGGGAAGARARPQR